MVVVTANCIELPMELRNSKKGLINMKNKDEECFRWCHIRHLNPQIKDPERIKKEDKKIIELNYDGVDFPLSQKHYKNVENRTASESMCLVMKMDNH